jgi:phosphatidylserine decarboxylase
MERAYVRFLGVDMSEAERPGPYESFDAFFTRPLKAGARDLDDAPVISPADGKLLDVGPITDTSELLVKGQRYSVPELCGDQAVLDRYRGGQFAVVYLSPRDYHRVHSPVDGQVSRVRGIDGDSYPVNAISNHLPGVFVRNRRAVIELETDSVGLVTVIMVGALIVGRISVTGVPGREVPNGNLDLSPALAFARGDELGKFHLGSTVVLLLEPGLAITRPLGTIRYGQALAVASAGGPTHGGTGGSGAQGMATR